LANHLAHDPPDPIKRGGQRHLIPAATRKVGQASLKVETTMALQDIADRHFWLEGYDKAI
jgi:hypothetical protein